MLPQPGGYKETCLDCQKQPGKSVKDVQWDAAPHICVNGETNGWMDGGLKCERRRGRTQGLRGTFWLCNVTVHANTPKSTFWMLPGEL